MTSKLGQHLALESTEASPTPSPIVSPRPSTAPSPTPLPTVSPNPSPTVSPKPSPSPVLLAPTNLTYSNLAPSFVKGAVITPLRPSSQGGAPTNYTASALPVGLTISAVTGVISGTPTTAQPATPCRVTATNSAGSVSVTFPITVLDPKPTSLAYSSPKIVYRRGAAIRDNTPISTGGLITSYSVSPALPAGLSLNASTGVISGTPTTQALPAAFTVTGRNTSGSITAPITIGVFNPDDPNATYSFIQSRILTPQCNNCHKTDGVPGAADYTTYAGLKSSFSAGNALLSSLYIRTAPGAASPMPPGGVLSNLNSFAILNWISLGAPEGAVTPSPTPTPTPSDAPGTEMMIPNEARLRLSNRHYIASALIDIFGSNAVVPVGKLISAPVNVGVLGGPCNAYSNMGRIDYATSTLGSDCATVPSAEVAAIPLGSSARGATITRTCDLILSQDNAVYNAASQALNTSVSPSTLPAMDASSVAKAYGLFYIGRPIPSAIATALLTVANSGENALESWRFTLLTLCYAPDWQIQ